MNPERLLELYERVGEAPDAIPRLRRFVLDLAVRGKLVEQDPRDEPASKLLGRIAEEKEKLIRSSKTPRSRTVSESDLEIPFHLPDKWKWTRLGAIASYIQRGKSPKYAQSDGVPVVSQKCVQWSGLDLSVARQITLESLVSYEEYRFLRSGDLLWNSTGTGTIGRVIQVSNSPERLVCDSHVTVVRCVISDPEYIRTWLRSDFVYGAIEGRASGSTNQVELTAQMAINQIVPLPPLAEQHRIVAKVDELMALLDRLEAEHAHREEIRDKLATASFSQLTAPETDHDDFMAHADFAIKVLPDLTTRPDQIKVLRQTILDLAVRGRLVEQDPNDEPADFAIELIARDKAKREVRKRNQHSIQKTTDKKVYPVPRTWAWAPLGNLVISRDGERIPVSREERNQREKIYDYYGASGVIDKIDGYLFDAPLLLIGEDGANLINRSTPIAFMARGKYWVNNHAHVLDGISESFLSYLELYINATDLRPYITGTAQPKMNQAKMNMIPVAVPPFQEQERIVARVRELEILCDELGRGRLTLEDRSLRLLEAVLTALLHEQIPSFA